MEKISRNIHAIILLIFVGMVAVIWYAVFHFEARQNLLVTFFDVGQGDAIFIEVPNGNQILVDGGPGDRILAKLGNTLPFWDRSIDLLILTHPHADHLDGLLEVLKRYDVGMVLEPGVPHSIPEYQEWREVLGRKNVPVVVARVGEGINAGAGVVMDVLAPFDDCCAASVKNVHDANVVARLTHGKTLILLTGDAEKMIEYRLFFESPEMIDADILKVGHHGSKTSTTEEFLAAVSPDVAVIQVGRKNRFGHPYQGVLERLAGASAKILRTDRDRDIRIWSDGARYGLLSE